MITVDFTSRIEIFSIIKAKLEVAELVLKALKIEYKIVPPKTHTSKLWRLMYETPLDQVNDILASLGNGSRIYAEQIKRDFEARRYWRKRFQKFQEFKKFNSTN
ncbi:MAG: hypothetical protein KAX18_14855 [Candidatus Lokiarchaeota archaeon]|nr:hypothetical protein [Candidatus Lokiarchaeota archaeon]